MAKNYTTTEIEEIKSLHKDGLTHKEIAELMGRTEDGIRNAISRFVYGHGYQNDSEKKSESEPVKQPEPVKVFVEKTLNDFPERQMIKHLYDKGYRWDNLYCMVKQKVNINDIIANG